MRGKVGDLGILRLLSHPVVAAVKSVHTHPQRVIAREHTSASVCYEILDILGEGGSGVTYRAIDSHTQQLVALKALSLHRIDDWKAIELFDREAQVLSALDRDGIPKYLDYFTIDIAGDRYFYIVQALAPGKTLAEWMQSGWHATEAEAKQIAIDILKLLIYLHRHTPPIVHRDIKPSNILRTEDGKISLVDFGAVQQTYHDTFMRGSTVVGTYGYMAPEQFRGQAVPATDLYGLGATILHLLTHRSPAEIPQDGLRLNFRDRLQVSGSFIDWLERMLEPDASHRFSSAAKALSVLNSPPKTKFKPTFGKFDRFALGLVGLTIFVSIFLGLDRYKYYFLDRAGFITTEPFAAMSKQPQVGQIREFIKRGFNVNTKDKNDRTLIDLAIENDLPDVVNMLIEEGANVSNEMNLIDPDKAKYKSLEEERKQVERQLNVATAYVNESYRKDVTAELDRRKDEQQKIIENGLNKIAYYAVRRDRVDMLKLLLDRGVKIDRAYPDNNQLSLLHLASVHQSGEMVKLLLDRGLDPNLKDNLGCTPLHTAIARYAMPYTPALSNYINLDNSSDNLPSKQAIEALVKAGAKIDARCNLDERSLSDRDENSLSYRIRKKSYQRYGMPDRYTTPVGLVEVLGIRDINLNSYIIQP